nr:tuliposide A-converting enzyme 2, chloroplastic-like [Coffea arabica]
MPYFLDIEVSQVDGGIFVSQKKYVGDILEKFKMNTAKPTMTPVEEKLKLIKDCIGKFVDATFGDTKLPLLVYLHGGGFLIKSAFSPTHHAHLNVVVAEAVKWVAPHSNGEGPEVWLRDYASFDRVFFGGDSAGGNLAHNMASRVKAYVKDIWHYVHPKSTGIDDPLLNSRMKPNLLRLGFVVAKKVGHFHQQECCVDASLSG